MNIVSAFNISKSFEEKYLFKNISFGLEHGDKIALVGVNGCGKSTLLKMVAGIVPSEEGEIAINKDIRIGYLSQDPQFEEGTIVKEALYNTESEVLQTIQIYETLIQQENINDIELQDIIEKMDRLSCWDIEQRAKEVISKMGITDLDANVNTLSGGQKKRLALARLIIDQPNLLILDEPTNHLDLDTIEWLEHLLSNDQTTLLLVTHDRYFLDNVCNQIIEIDQQQLFTYKGKYINYLELKDQREQQQLASVEKAKNLYKRELEWIRRQPKARGTKAKYRIDAFQDTKEKAFSLQEKQKIELEVKTSRQGNKIAELTNIHKKFDSKEIIKDFSYIFKKNDKIGIVGKNGTGKSTFLNLLTNREELTSGIITLGQTTQIGYYTQSGIQLDEDMRVIDVVKEIAEFVTLADGKTISASKFLELFLFPPALQYSYVSKLSGGERKRLHLMQVLVKSPNFLILDEPTNDLDMDTLNALEIFLEKFNGSLLIVSHDRYFMDKLVDQLFVFEGAGKITIFNGNYSDYRLEQDELEKELKQIEKQKNNDIINTPQSDTKKSNKLSYKEKRELEELEQKISLLESQKQKVLDHLNSTTDYSEIEKLSKEIEQIDNTLNIDSERWMELLEKDS